MSGAAPLTRDTRWRDRVGREWRILEKLPFGRNLCCIADRPAVTGEWTTKEIREVLAELEAFKRGEIDP